MNRLYKIAFLIFISTFTFSNAAMANTFTDNISVLPGHPNQNKHIGSFINKPEMDHFVEVCIGGVCYIVPGTH